MAHLLIYGGTFDPIHHGHLLPCRAARELLAADRVVLIPAWVSPHKKEGPPAATSQQRLEMVQLAIQGQADFAADDREIRRGQSGGVSFTFDTMEEIRREHPADTYTLLVGEDQLPKFHLWHRVRDLVTQMPVAVMTRGPAGGAGISSSLPLPPTLPDVSVMSVTRPM